MRKKKNIANILDTLKSVFVASPSLTFKNLRRLGFVLATQTPNISFSLSKEEERKGEEMEFDEGELTEDSAKQAIMNIE